MALVLSVGVMAAAIAMPWVMAFSGLLKFRPQSTAKVLATVTLLLSKLATQPQVASPLKPCAAVRMVDTKVPREDAPLCSAWVQYCRPPASAPSGRPSTLR